MKRLVHAGVLAASMLWLNAPARASVPPPLAAPHASLQNGSLHVDVYGTAGKPALIFIPGLTCGPWEWAGEIERLSPHYTIYALTLPGFDGRPAIAGDLFASVSADFWTLLASQKIQRPIVIGHSLGGTLAIMLAEQHSERLRAVIAVDGMPVFPGFDTFTPAQREAAAQQFQAMAGDPAAALPMLITSPADVAAIAPLARKSDPKAVGAWAAQDIVLDLRPNLQRITVPLLEIEPGAAQKAYYESLLAGDSTARVASIEGSRHFIMYDQPQALHETISQFIGSLR